MTERDPRGYDPEGDPWYDDGVTPPGGRWAIWDYGGRKWDPLPADYDPGQQARADLAARIVAAVQAFHLPFGVDVSVDHYRDDLIDQIVAAIREASDGRA